MTKAITGTGGPPSNGVTSAKTTSTSSYRFSLDFYDHFALLAP